MYNSSWFVILHSQASFNFALTYPVRIGGIVLICRWWREVKRSFVAFFTVLSREEINGKLTREFFAVDGCASCPGQGALAGWRTKITEAGVPGYTTFRITWGLLFSQWQYAWFSGLFWGWSEFCHSCVLPCKCKLWLILLDSHSSACSGRIPI